MATRDEADAIERFTHRYRVGTAAAATAVERMALDADFGGTGYTTRAQADELVGLLALEASSELLDLGAGCGWPGLYLAAVSGCRMVGTDLPLEGLRRGQGRAAADGLADRAAMVVASARRLPFRPASFNAVVHTDVLC